MQKIIIVMALFLTRPLSADTSWFFKLATLRFVHEEVVFAQQGTVDLRSMRDGILHHIQGEALFVPGTYLEPRYLDEADYQNLLKEKGAITFPLRLKSSPIPLDKVNSNFGTFILKVRVNAPQDLKLDIPRYYHAIELFLADARKETKLFSLGKLDRDPSRNTWLYSLSEDIPAFRAESDFYLYAHVSSPLIPGENTIPNLSSFYVGDPAFLSRFAYVQSYFIMAISGCFLIVFLFYFFIYTFRRRDRSSLYLSLYALCSYGLSVFQSLEFPLTPQKVVELFTYLNVLSIASLQFYLLDKIKFVFSPRLMKYCQGFTLVTMIGTLGSVYWSLGFSIAIFFFASFLSSIALILGTSFIGLRYRLNGIPYFLVGAALNMVFQFTIMMSYIRGTNDENGYYILLANFFMAIALALVNAKEFAVTYQKTVDQSIDLEEKNREITFFNRNLEKLVHNKTHEIRSLLDHIPQGVLSIGAGGLIAKDYSAHLKDIIELDGIDGQSFKTLILDRCDMNADLRDQAWQSILNSVDDVALNFQLNEDKFPRELLYTVNGNKKYLKVTWNGQIEEDRVVRLLVTLLDVSLEKQLEMASQKQREELILIQELINVPAAKMAQFFSTSIPLMQESAQILHGAEPLTLHRVRLLFVNAHTVKGAARTLHLQELARAVHEMEEHYSQIIRTEAAIDQGHLLEHYDRVQSLFQKYDDINRNRLNRSQDYQKVTIEREFIEHHYRTLKGLITSPDLSKNSLVQIIKEQSEALTSRIFEELPVIFDGYKERAAKIAKDLGKAAPRFDFTIEQVSVVPPLKTVLDNCMIHILRNALDHGIEGSTERQNQNKPAEGLIRIQTQVIGEQLRIEVSDDGRGLAIQKLREKGLQMGLIHAASTTEEIAELIFHSGVSTSHGVSDISGRGIGMSAVRSFLENVGGSIQIKLQGATEPDGHYVQFSFLLELPLSSEDEGLKQVS